MAETLKERAELDRAFMWDLTPMYKDDAAWEDALSGLDAKIEKLVAFQGTLKDADTLLAFFAAETDANLLLEDLYTYAFLRKSEDTRAEKAQQMYAKIYGKAVQAATATAWAKPEILSLPEEQLKALAEDEKLADYHYQMVQLLREKPHTLTADQEQLLAAFGETFGAPKEIANTLDDADLIFEPAADSEGEMHEVTGSNFVLLQTSGDRVLRENAFRSFYKGYKQHINTFAATYQGQVKYETAQAAVRHYENSRAMAMADENIPASVYDNLVATVRKHLPDMYRYVELRKKLLQVPELHLYDIYAPLVLGDSERYTYEQAQEIVLDTVSVFGEEYVETVKKAFKDRWIDVYPNKGKSGGAYSSGTYTSAPYIMTNFSGTLDAVSTIAHEMGHSMHTWHSNRAQKPQNASYTLFVAEVASTVNENLMIEKLLSECTDPKARLALLNQYLENFKGTVYRQVMFAEFEQRAHALAETGEGLNAATLNRMYAELVRDYFGDGLAEDEEYQYEWARIPHFYRPFYVYKYATGYSTAVALSEGIRNPETHDEAVKKYIEFLSMGGSADPLDELKHAGVDLTTPEPVETALNKFAQVLDEAERCAAEILG